MTCFKLPIYKAYLRKYMNTEKAGVRIDYGYLKRTSTEGRDTIGVQSQLRSFSRSPLPRARRRGKKAGLRMKKAALSMERSSGKMEN